MSAQYKKIAVISDAIYPFNKGGKEKRIYDVTTRLALQGHDVTIYCMKWWDGENEIIQNGVKLHAISKYYPLYKGERRSLSEAVFFALACLKLVFKDFDIIDVDHVPHLAIFTAKIACLLKKKPMTATWHEVWGKKYWKKYLGPFKGSIAYVFEKNSVKLPDTIISVSDHTTAALKEVLSCKVPIFTIPNGVDLSIINESLPSQAHYDVIFAGRLLLHKNVDLLLKAIDIVKKDDPNISLAIVGNGPEETALKKLSKDLKLDDNVTYLNFFEDHHDLYGLFKSSKVSVLPSIREGFGIMAIEANACGTPFITIDHPENAAKDLVIHGENGLLSSLEENDLAHSIKTLLKDRKEPAFYEKYSQKYNWDGLIFQMAEVHGIKQHDAKETTKKIEHPSLEASVVVLTLNSAKNIKKTLDAICAQKFENYEVICIDSSSTDGTPDIVANYPVRLISIKAEDFGHGKTRNYAARIAKGKFVVFLTHDSMPEKEHWLSHMLAAFNDPQVAGTYGRQIPRPEENILDKHFQSSLYLDKAEVWESGNWKQGDNIFSDANSALRRDILLQYPYADDIIVSEDYEWAARIMKLGYKIIYSPSATVIHSHSYNLYTLFKRNFDVGVSYRTIYSDRRMRHFMRKGLTIMSQEIAYLYKHGHARLIPRAIFRDMIRFAGIQAGKNEWLFSKKFKRNYLSAQRWYWK